MNIDFSEEEMASMIKRLILLIEFKECFVNIEKILLHNSLTDKGKVLSMIDEIKRAKQLLDE